MARILEPLLWRRFNHLQVAGNVIETEDIDLDLAANEGVLIQGLDFLIQSFYTVAATDFTHAVVARPDAGDSIDTQVELMDDTDFVASQVVNVAVLTSGAIIKEHERDWRAPGVGLVIARRMTYLTEHSAANVRTALTVWYRRIIFSDDEMLGLLIRRR